MVQTATEPATYDDLFDLPAHRVGQIIHGELHAHPRPAPAPAHAHTASTLGMDIGSPFQRGRGGPGGWWIFDEPELHLDRHVLVSDLAGWRRERLPALPEQAYFVEPPDWVCEIVSPATARIDRIDKLPIYAEHAVGHCWMVDPGARSLEVFALEAGHWRLVLTASRAETVHAPPFAAVALELDALWLAQTGEAGG